MRRDSDSFRSECGTVSVEAGEGAAQPRGSD